jgi:WD40 repeat protein
VTIDPRLKNIEKLLIHRGFDGLNDVQTAILVGTLAGESYGNIADRTTYAVEYLREIGSSLWKLLSEILGEPITKKNLQLALQRYQKSWAAEELEQQYFWGEAIDVSIFYGRTAELQTLQRWITQDRCRLIEILAIGGMGKTALAVKIAQQIAGEFEFVLWRSLRNAPPFIDLLGDMIALLSGQQETAIDKDPALRTRRLMHYLRQHRCLLILDNVESILLSGQPHQYLAGYESYGELFQQIGACPHQSCLILTSREQVAEIASVAGAVLPVRIFPLKGLSIADGISILDDKGLTATEDTAQDLLDLYGGNPLALKIVSTSIVELFDRKIAAFLQQGTTVFNGIRMLLEKQWERLCPLEQQVMFWLAIHREWVSLGELQNDLWPVVSAAQLLEVLEYLQGRCLIEGKGGRFTQQPVVMEYVTNQLLQTIRLEIIHRSPQLLLSYGLMKAHTKEYLRESQIRLILQPLLQMLDADLGGRNEVVTALQQILAQLAIDPITAASYGAGNCLNLLCQLSTDLTQLDLSGLTIRQADLRSVPLPQVNFTNANLSTALFSESIGDICRVAISPDSRLVAKGGSDGKIAIWQMDRGQNILNLKAHAGHVVGLVFTADSQRLISSSFDRTIKIWDIQSQICLQTWQLLAPVYRIALSPDGRMLASSSNCGDVLLWDVATGQLIKTLTGHSLTVVDVAFQPQGHLLASGSFDTTIKIWDLETGECLQTLAEHQQIVTAIDFHPQGHKLVSGSFDTTIKIWDLESGLCLQTIQQHSKTVIDVLFSPNGQQMISASQDLTVRLWDKGHDWQCIKVLHGHENIIWSIALNAQGTTLITSDQSGIMKFWDVLTGQCVRTVSSVARAFRAVAFHPNGKLLASSSEDRQIRLWDLETHECLSTIAAHEMAVWQIAFSPCGKFLASGGFDGVVKLWDVVENCRLQAHAKPLQISSGLIVAVTFHPILKILATGGAEQTSLWNYQTGELLHIIDCPEIGDLAFDPTGQFLATASHDSAIKLWNITTGKCHHTFLGHQSENWAVAFHPQGQLLASGGEDPEIRLWDLNGDCQLILTGHTGAIASLAFSPDGLYLASASKDHTIRIWEVATGNCLNILTQHQDLVNFVAFHPNGKQLATCSHDETIRLWETDFWIGAKVLRPERLYEGMNITSAQGLSESQVSMLKSLGAIAH